MAWFLLALQNSDLCQQKDKYFGVLLGHESKENESSAILCVSAIEALCFFSFYQPHKYLGLMSKSETKKELRDILCHGKVPTQSPSFTEQGSSFHLAQYSTCAYFRQQ